MSSSATAPWLAHYPQDLSVTLEPPFATVLDAFDHSVATTPDLDVIRYFDGTFTFEQFNAATDALATALVDNGFQRGNGLALFTQNNPAFLIGLVAAWKAGGHGVAINPMNKARELTYLLQDSGATALICLDSLYSSVAKGVIAELPQQFGLIATTNATDFQTRNDARVLDLTDGAAPAEDAGPPTLVSVLSQYSGRRPAADRPQPKDVAVLTYTSGTTGEPKAAMNTHSALSFTSHLCRGWMRLGCDDVILGMAPLFHITGLVGHIGAALVTPCPVVLSHRFHPGVLLDAIAEHRPTFTVGAITAFNSMVAASNNPQRDFASLRTIYSGGAPIAPAAAEEFHRLTGSRIHNIYGLTETTAPALATPLGESSPVDPMTGALSVGVPPWNTTVRILDDTGQELPPGEIGEIAVRGPQVIPGYWNKPAQTAEAIVDGELRTGDIGYMNDDGWFFIVDRKKDMINASGYKVWPREVEDVLCAHAAVREAAVIGEPDPYRGETVKAFVSLKPGHTVSDHELIEYCKATMAAYKYPRSVEIVNELPKTLSGKILRRSLRERHGAN